MIRRVYVPRSGAGSGVRYVLPAGSAPAKLLSVYAAFQTSAVAGVRIPFIQWEIQPAGGPGGAVFPAVGKAASKLAAITWSAGGNSLEETTASGSIIEQVGFGDLVLLEDDSLLLSANGIDAGDEFLDVLLTFDYSAELTG